MNELALFAGAGGGLLGTRLLRWRVVCYVERDEYCVGVLKARIRDGYLDDSPIWDDVRTFDGRPWVGSVDIVTAGFPCQPFSVAGKGLAELDDRNLWPDTIRIARECGAEWLLLENVPGLLSKPYIRRIFADLAESGYDTRHACISAADVGANHKRERLWIVAHAHGTSAPRLREHSGQGEETAEGVRFRVGERSADVANPSGERLQDGRKEPADGTRASTDGDRGSWWAVEPELGRVAHGVAHRVDRLRAIGNGQVPAVVRRAWEELSK